MTHSRHRRPSLSYPEEPVHRLLAKTADRLPRKAAVIDPEGGRELSYQDLERESDALAQVLLEWGLRRGDRISFFLRNGWEYFVGFYGAVKAGAVVSPMNPTLGQREARSQIDDAGSRVLLVQQDLFPPLQEALPEASSLEKILIARGPDPAAENTFSLEGLLKRPPAPRPSPLPPIHPREDLAALPYSSGTAGLSKGVRITHFNLLSNAIQAMHAVEARESDVLISFLPFHHIYGFTYFLCGSVYLGATQVVMPRFHPEECLLLLQKYRGTLLFGVQPSLLSFLDVPDLGRFDLSSLRYIWSGAAPLAPAVSRRIREKFGVPVARHYGLSEASPTTHCSPPERPKEGSVGIAVSDLEDRIMDLETGKTEMKTGEPGELAVRGPNVFEGYWKHPEDTRLALRDGWLYTGDVAWKDEEGYVFVLDRKKEMIRSQGGLIAPAELEAALMDHPAVQDCAVAGVPGQAGEEIPKAFIVKRQGFDPSPEEILAFVAERVAPHKRIRAVAFVPEIPKTLSGKVLRRVLRAAF